MTVKYEKMSKSRGNVVVPDEVVYGVSDLADGFEFRHVDGRIIRDFKALGVWRDRGGDSMYYTSSRTGRLPVFLCRVGDWSVPEIEVGGVAALQHAALLESRPDIFGSVDTA